ncbi:unnamed protein product, partial [Ectocarpus fasciculatus]
ASHALHVLVPTLCDNNSHSAWVAKNKTAHKLMWCRLTLPLCPQKTGGVNQNHEYPLDDFGASQIITTLSPRIKSCFKYLRRVTGFSSPVQGPFDRDRLEAFFFLPSPAGA